jgi:hypothetical protein
MGAIRLDDGTVAKNSLSIERYTLLDVALQLREKSNEYVTARSLFTPSSKNRTADQRC